MDENQLRRIMNQVEKEIKEQGITDDFEKETYYRSRMMYLNLHLMEIETVNEPEYESNKPGIWRQEK